MSEAPFINRDEGMAVSEAAMFALSETFPTLAEDVLDYSQALPSEEEADADDDVRLIADNQILLVLLAGTTKALLALEADNG